MLRIQPDLKKLIDAKIAKWQELRRMADDPEMESMLRSLIDSAVPAPLALSSGWPAPAPRPANPSGRGQLKATVLKILAESGKSLTTNEIADLMSKQGFEFNSQRPYVAVNEALNTWQLEGRVKVDRTEGRQNFWVTADSAQEMTQ
jgi:hypothetical protein